VTLNDIMTATCVFFQMLFKTHSPEWPDAAVTADERYVGFSQISCTDSASLSRCKNTNTELGHEQRGCLLISPTHGGY